MIASPESHFDAEFPLTAEESQRCESLRIKGSEAAWLEIANGVRPHLLQAYANDEIDFQQLLEITRACAIACTAKHRVFLQGVAADCAARCDSIVRNGKRPPVPIALQAAAVDLMLWVKETHDLPLAPREGVESVTSATLELLGLVRLFPVPKRIVGHARRSAHSALPKPATLYRWYREHMRDRAGVASLPPGRPRKR